MPFGLVNVPSTFQKSMNLLLQGLKDETSCYIDDIVVFSEEWDEHLGQIRNVLQRLRQFGLTANPQKCMWGVAEVEYLGYKVGEGKVSVPEIRIVALHEFL